MYPIKQSTAITVAFFVHDANGDAVLSLVDGGFTKRISKNGAAFGAMTVTITEMENGWYSIPLSSAHSDTTGILTILFTHGSAKQVNLQFRVHANLPDDLSTAAALTTHDGKLDTVDTVVDAIKLETDKITLGDAGAGVAGSVIEEIENRATPAQVATELATYDGPTSAEMNARTILAAAYFDPAVDTVTVGTNNDKTGYALSTAGILAIWHQLTSAIVTAGTIGKLLKDEVTSARMAELDAANLPADVDTLLSRLSAARAALLDGITEARLAELDPANIPADVDGIKAKTDALPDSPTKNAVLTYTILMRDSTTEDPLAGLTVTGQRALDGAALASMTGTITEISNGLYKVAASAADMNGDTVAHRFTATGAKDLLVEFITQA